MSVDGDGDGRLLTQRYHSPLFDRLHAGHWVVMQHGFTRPSTF